jgi:hypothetical protein
MLTEHRRTTFSDTGRARTAITLTTGSLERSYDGAQEGEAVSLGAPLLLPKGNGATQRRSEPPARSRPGRRTRTPDLDAPEERVLSDIGSIPRKDRGESAPEDRPGILPGRSSSSETARLWRPRGRTNTTSAHSRIAIWNRDLRIVPPQPAVDGSCRDRGRSTPHELRVGDAR